jgi:hypothetical protein
MKGVGGVRPRVPGLTPGAKTACHPAARAGFKGKRMEVVVARLVSPGSRPGLERRAIPLLSEPEALKSRRPGRRPLQAGGYGDSNGKALRDGRGGRMAERPSPLRIVDLRLPIADLKTSEPPRPGTYFRYRQ